MGNSLGQKAGDGPLLRREFVTSLVSSCYKIQDGYVLLCLSVVGRDLDDEAEHDSDTD